MDKTQDESETSASNNPAELSPDTDDILAKYEEMFASRYTEDDPAYLPYINKGMDPPPIVENYVVRRQRPNWDNSRRESRSYEDRRRSHDDDRGYPDPWKRQRLSNNQGNYHDRGGRSYYPHRGHGGEGRWDHHPRQDRRGREEWSYRGNRQGGRYHGEGGQYSGSYKDQHRPHPPQDEWT